MIIKSESNVSVFFGRDKLHKKDEKKLTLWCGLKYILDYLPRYFSQNSLYH